MVDHFVDDRLSEFKEARSLFDEGRDEQSFCIGQIEELFADCTSDVSKEQIDDIAMFLYRSEGLSKDVGTFTKILSLLQLKESSCFTAQPMLTDDICTGNFRQFDLFYEYSNNDFGAVPVEIERELSMADIVRELGYGCTVNTAHCKDLLFLFLPLNEVTISKLLGTIVRTHIGLEDTQNAYLMFCSALDITSTDPSLLKSWNIDVLVESIKLLAPKTNWTLVVENLDHEGFHIPDETSFSLLMSAYVKACQDPFPLHAICGAVWKNLEGQLSFLRHAVVASPDIFTFAHCSRKLTYVDTLLSNGHENQAWLCLDLLEVICQLVERGYASSVWLMLEHPINNCPEVLLVGIAQINTVYNFLQYEVASIVFPSILKDSTKSSIIQHIWRVNPNLVLWGFADAHTDPNNLFRILDFCQELKILSTVLETIPFPFGIKLAAIAFTKEHINLEKWLNDNLNTSKDTFSEDCLKFLKEVLCDVANDVPDSSLQQSRASNANVYQETCSIFFKVLQAHPRQLGSHEFFEELKRVHFSSNSQIQSDVATISAKTEGSSDDIEAEVNAYLHQVFSGQLTIDAMIQMLAHFRESSEKREQLIFECLIANLFEEYKFFPKYPDKQLKLAAVLFGSLIKHQLVTHLALGIALRGVLDALRKSIDSKMFAFGTKALKQFIDRLVELPQYCNHILQISHLREKHTELVSVIERTLARVSSIQSESSGSNTLPADQPQGSTSASVETMEASEASWQLMSASSSQFSQQLSPFQLQQRHQGFLDDRLKTTVTTENYTKPVLSNSGQSSLVSAPVDSITSQKSTTFQSLQTRSSQDSASVTSAVSSSHGFVLAPRSITSAGMLRQPSYNTGFGAALNIETLVAAAERRDTPIEVPASEIQDKILFMINNISISNIEAKAKEFTEVLKEQYYSWFAQYMVMKRASIEPNFHDLYLKFLEKVNSRLLNKEIVKATYENCKALLRSDLIKSSSEERSLLKSLGSWLGKFTIGRNQALLAKEIDPKVLIIEAYEKGLMIAVVPFTSKILETCLCSLAYQPPNPWTMGILGLLIEIYNLPNLKMNLKFDIEVLFRNIGVNSKDVKPTSLLKDRVHEVEGNPDFSNKDVTASQPPVIAEVNSGIMPTLNQAELQPDVNNTSQPSSHPNVLTQHSAPLHLASNAMVEGDKVGALITPERVPSGQGLTQVASSTFSLSQLLRIIPNSDSYININPKLSSMGPQMQFHRIIQVGMDLAIREIVSPIIMRSVTIAIRTTRELVTKDYAMESDDSIILRVARLMVGTLAGSLAHVTCKEPLRAALLKHLRNVLQIINVNGERSEEIVQILTTDHLDLGCAVIENVAYEKAVDLIDGEMAPSFNSIRKQRDLSGSAYYAVGAYAQGSFACLPEALRPKPGHLSVAQQHVYNDFIRNIWQDQLSQSPNVDTGQIPEEANCGSAQVLSVSSAHTGTNDDVMHPNVEIRSIAGSFPAVASAGSHSVEASTVPKESGAVVPPSPSAPVTERLGIFLSESLSTTGDAVDKYEAMIPKVTLWFDDWCQFCVPPAINDTAYSHCVSQLLQNGWLEGDDVTDFFFRILTVLSVEYCLPTGQIENPGSFLLQSTQHLSFLAIDAYAKLLVLLLKVDQGSSKLFLLPEILSVTVRGIQDYADDQKSSFNPRPYFRLFVNLLLDLTSPDPVLDGANFQVLTSFANAFHALQPLKVPGWSFAWLELVSHRSFMPKLLAYNTPKGWPYFQRLLVDLFKFMEPYLRNAEMRKPVHFLYKGTLRVLLVLLNDFPEFLCDYHFSFCDVIPPSCIQMRNVILSAFPQNMRLPDPSTPNLKIDLLAEISQSPRILSDVDGALKAKQIKADVDEYLKTRAEGSFLFELKQRLLLPPSEVILAGTRYNVPLINSLVLYVGMQGIQKLQSKCTQHTPTQQMAHCSPMDISLADGAMDIFPSLIKNLDTEGRYMFLNAIANQLRYPNSHTHFFSFVLLYLFAEASQEIDQEQITRVLLERLIVNRPHPWGLLITFIELIKNPRYNFWNRAFTRCAPEIEKWFGSMSRSCGGPNKVDDGMVFVGIPDGNH